MCIIISKIKEKRNEMQQVWLVELQVCNVAPEGIFLKKIKYKTLKLYLKTKSLPKHINFEKIHLSKFK